MERRSIRDIRNSEFIQATLQAVQQKGFQNVTLSEIAAYASTTAASITYHFGSKENLLEATMRHLLELLRREVINNLKEAKTSKQRLQAVLAANFSDSLFTKTHCNVWVQFWSAAPYQPALARLQKINRSRVASHLRRETQLLVASERQHMVEQALQSYIDGVWISAAQSTAVIDAKAARKDINNLLDLLVCAG